MDNLNEESNEETIRANRIFETISYFCEMIGFDIVEPIVLEDRKTGKVWRQS